MGYENLNIWSENKIHRQLNSYKQNFDYNESTIIGEIKQIIHEYTTSHAKI